MTQFDTTLTQETCVSTTSLVHAKAIELAKHAAAGHEISRNR